MMTRDEAGTALLWFSLVAAFVLVFGGALWGLWIGARMILTGA